MGKDIFDIFNKDYILEAHIEGFRHSTPPMIFTVEELYQEFKKRLMEELSLPRDIIANDRSPSTAAAMGYNNKIRNDRKSIK